MASVLDIISNCPLFEGLPEKQIEDIQYITIEKKYSKGEIIFAEGDDGNGFFIVADGRVKIYKVSMEGKEQILHIFGQGEPIGEVPVFIGQKFPAFAEAIEKSRLIFFPRKTFIELISKSPSLALNMIGLLAKRLRQFTVQVENLSLKEVPGRLAAYLVLLSEEQKNSDRIVLSISKGQLASLLGTIPETLSRILSKMSSNSLIHVDGRHITLLDMEGLEDLAENGKI